jgi:hypothetical protein
LRPLAILCWISADAPALQWDPAKPSTIGSPLRIGSHPHCQEFDELAEVMSTVTACWRNISKLLRGVSFDLRISLQVEARWIIPLIAKKNEVLPSDVACRASQL